MRGVLIGVVTALLLEACGGEASGPAIAELAKRPPVTDTTARSSKVIATSDLPPVVVGDDGVARDTRSLFDHLVLEADGVPWPFEKLVALVGAQDPAGAKPLTLLIPDGRSLLKGQADFAHPRVLVAADYQSPGSPASLGLAPRGQLFLGFTELANEIEVISYNEAAGRFEFQLVQDYSATGARKLVYAKRAICESCHQGATPIFSVRPWNETNGQPETAAKIAAAQEVRSGGQDYLGLPAAVPLASPERYDELTDVASYLVAAQKFWLDQCATPACRRQLLALALDYARAPGDFDPASAAAANLKAAFVPQASVAVPPSDLANRDPIGEAKGIKGWWRGLFKPEVKLGDGAKTNEDLEAFDRLPRLPAAQDPLASRPPRKTVTANDLDAVYALAAFFTPDDVRRLTAAAGDWPAVQARVASLPEAFFADAPFARVKTLQALLAPATVAYCCLDTAEMSPPIASGEPPVMLAAASPLQPYADYCFACHRGNPSKRLNFMSGATEAEVTANIQDKSEIREALDWPRYQGTDKAAKLMPPTDSPQYAAMQEAMQQNPKLLEQMQAVVPGLFEF
jgi:hypothetical protein